jgi:hypothetical protein
MSKNGAQNSKIANQASVMTAVLGPAHQGWNEVTNFGKMMSHNSSLFLSMEFQIGPVHYIVPEELRYSRKVYMLDTKLSD